MYFCCDFDHSSCLLLGRAGNCAGEMGTHGPCLATGQAEGECLTSLVTGMGSGQGMPAACVLLLELRRQISPLLHFKPCSSVQELQCQGTGSCQGWGTAVLGSLANVWGGSWGSGAAPYLGIHPSSLSDLTWCQGGWWHLHFWGDKLTLLCLSLPAWESWLCAFLGFPSCLSD